MLSDRIKRYYHLIMLTLIKCRGVKCLRKCYVALLVSIAGITLLWVFSMSRDEVATSSDLFRRCDVESVRLLIVVASEASRSENRLAVRQTWGTVASRKDVDVIFYVGKPLDDQVRATILEEVKLYGDVVVHDAVDYGTVLFLKWMGKCCPNAQFVLKTDDDCFLNPFNLLDSLPHVPSAATVYGRLDPPELFGPSYLVTHEAVVLFGSSVEKCEWIDEENASAIGTCAEMLGIPIVDRDGLDVLQIASLCVSKEAYTLDGVSTNSMRMFWWFINDDRIGDDCETNLLIDVDLSRS